jgi:hypothetical protein
MKNKILAALAALALSVGVATAAAPAANAVYGNSVVNHSIGWVQIKYDDGRYAYLAGYGAYATNVHYVVIQYGSCVSVDLHKYCAPYNTYYVTLNLGQHTVNRNS